MCGLILHQDLARGLNENRFCLRPAEVPSSNCLNEGASTNRQRHSGRMAFVGDRSV